MQTARQPAPDTLSRHAAAVLARLRQRAPRVHAITNAVAQNFTANALLAVGAVPSMTISAEEIGAFVTRADALLVNLGTFDPERRAATAIALESAAQAGVPWVLDPVFIDRAPQRLAFARDLVALRPKTVRLNSAEFAALAGEPASAEAVGSFARAHDVVVAVSGAQDIVADATRCVMLCNGDPLMARVTAMGCAGSAILAGCLAVEPDAFLASASALMVLGVAGECASRAAKGPGSFAAAILDALYALDEAALMSHAKVSA